MLSIDYLATEFAGDPPRPVARWYKAHAGTYARFAENSINFFHPADLKVEQSVGRVIEYVAGDGGDAEIAAIDDAWRQRGASSKR